MNQSLKETARQLFLATLAKVDPARLIAEQLQPAGDSLLIKGEALELAAYERILVIGFGKASLKMGVALEALLGARLSEGLLATNALLDPLRPQRLAVTIGGHPYPDAGSLAAADQALALAATATEQTLIFFLVSGGGSAILERPLEPQISLGDLRELNRLLVTCGARIREINAVRKHLSAVKGGRLAARAPHARKVSLYISDVNRSDLSTIASDPTGPDDTTLAECYDTIERYELLPQLPPSIASLFTRRALTETAKADDPAFRTSSRHLLMDNEAMLHLAADIAQTDGWQTEVDASNNEEHYRVVADRLLMRLKELCHSKPGQSICLISGGEVSCPVRGAGTGGRNQEFALYCATRLKNFLPGYQVAVLSGGTDGIDGNSDATGAVVDEQTLVQAEQANVPVQTFLDENDSYHFFAPRGELIMTGPTGTNVRDLRLLLAQPLA